MKKEVSRQADSVIFEGMTSINAVLNSDNGRRIVKVYFDKDKSSSKRRELSFLKYASEKHGFLIELISRDEIDAIAVGNSHGGVIAECTERSLPRLGDKDITNNGFFVMIEGIEDPYNFGYALRTLYAAGADGVILPERNWMSAAGVVCRASAGASELIPSYVANATDACEYFKNHGEPVSENPSPGNKEGGITTLEEKSLGCVQKGGTATIVDVLTYGEKVQKPGLSLLDGPGNDIVSVTNLSAAGCHMVLFTTGRGTPLGGAVPTVKIASNDNIANKKPHWIDFSAYGFDKDNKADELLSLIKEVADGKPTKNELCGNREIAIFKDGVTL